MCIARVPFFNVLCAMFWCGGSMAYNEIAKVALRSASYIKEELQCWVYLIMP